MDPIKQLHERLNHNVSQLVQRFENILAAGTAENTSHAATAVEENQMEVEADALIRAAEDLLRMTRAMKEMWYFGNLDTLGENKEDLERNKKLEEDVQAVEKAVVDGALEELCPAGEGSADKKDKRRKKGKEKAGANGEEGKEKAN